MQSILLPLRIMRIVIKIVLFFTIIALPILSYAPPGGSWNPGDTEPTVPISGGLLFLSHPQLFMELENISPEINNPKHFSEFLFLSL